MGSLKSSSFDESIFTLIQFATETRILFLLFLILTIPVTDVTRPKFQSSRKTELWIRYSTKERIFQQKHKKQKHNYKQKNVFRLVSRFTIESCFFFSLHESLLYPSKSHLVVVVVTATNKQKTRKKWNYLFLFITMSKKH